MVFFTQKSSPKRASMAIVCCRLNTQPEQYAMHRLTRSSISEKTPRQAVVAIDSEMKSSWLPKISAGCLLEIRHSAAYTEKLKDDQI